MLGPLPTVPYEPKRIDMLSVNHRIQHTTSTKLSVVSCSSCSHFNQFGICSLGNLQSECIVKAWHNKSHSYKFKEL